MTPFVGSYTNANSMFYFSNCSIRSITSTILSGTYVFDVISILLYSENFILNRTGKCLTNTPWSALASVYSTNSLYLPGQFYTIDQQCEINTGPNATYTKYCMVCLYKKYIFFYEYFIYFYTRYLMTQFVKHFIVVL
jgi:hypothetical protein